MVSSITTGAAGVSALGADPRFVRSSRSEASDAGATGGDAVQLGDGAGWRAVRDSVRDGLDQVRQVLAAGDDAAALLKQIQSLANDPDASQSNLDALLSQYSAGVDAAVDGGARLAAGEDVSVQAEPGAQPLVIAGLDLSLSTDQSASGAVSVSADAKLGPDLAEAARASLSAVNAGLSRLSDAARALEAHQGFIGAAAGAGDVRDDLDADSARLLALQVSQGLSAAGGAIANVEPQAVLALFRA